MFIDHAACSTARISITVTNFLEASRGCSEADVELTDTGHGTVSQGRVNDPIAVTGPVFLEFSLTAREGDRYTYSPVGISFKEVRGSNRDPLGHAAFPTRRFASLGNAMQLSLFDANPEPAEFKYDLVIQRSDGKLGIIDPTIRNNPVMK